MVIQRNSRVTPIGGSTKRGSIVLASAQVWHAVSAYAVLTSAARILGEEAFGDFGLVAWTMTTLELLVVTGIPRAVSYFTAHDPPASGAVVRRGLWMTVGLAAALTLVVAGMSAAIARLWHDEALAGPLRLAAVDFIVFAPFAVCVQAVNGLHLFARQASISMIYSTAKVTFAVGMLLIGGEMLWGIGGYVMASAVGSVAAVAGGLPWIRRGREPRTPSVQSYLEFGVPVACHTLVLGSMLTLDLWAAKWVATDRKQAAAYVAASTLARVLYLVFATFGEALFPGVTRLVAAGQTDRAARLARDTLRLLVGLLLPATALATGAAAPALALIFGGATEGPSAPAFPDAHLYLTVLAPAASMLVLLSVLASAFAAAGRPREMAGLLLALLAVDIGVVFFGAYWRGAIGAAMGVLISAATGLGVTTVWGARLFSANLFPVRSAVGALAVAAILHLLLRWWTPNGWLLLPYSVALLGGGLMVLSAGGALPVKGLVARETQDAQELG